MQTYRQYSPSGFDTKGLNADRYGIGDFLVVLGQNRDSGHLERSNFAAALALLGGESGEDEDGYGGAVQVHRFGHWACGWLEVLLVDPTNADKRAIAEDIARRLEDYPCLDEDDFSNREYQAATEYWARMSISERVEWLKRERDISVFAARRAELPEDIEISRLAE